QITTHQLNVCGKPHRVIELVKSEFNPAVKMYHLQVHFEEIVFVSPKKFAYLQTNDSLKPIKLLKINRMTEIKNSNEKRSAWAY
ncbi:MAG: hypothetical protein ACKO96_12455, partial [Flammeovirgaceae bacterium]